MIEDLAKYMVDQKTEIIRSAVGSLNTFQFPMRLACAEFRV